MLTPSLAAGLQQRCSRDAGCQWADGQCSTDSQTAEAAVDRSIECCLSVPTMSDKMHWAHSEPLSVVQTRPGLIDTPDRQDRAGGEQDANALAPRKSGLPPVQEHKQLEGEVTVHMLQLMVVVCSMSQHTFCCTGCRFQKKKWIP